MKRIGWTAMLLAVALLTAGCSNSDTNGDSKNGKSNSAAGTDSLPPPVDVEVPENVDGEKVTGAVGKALLKGLSGGPSESKTDDAPKFDP